MSVCDVDAFLSLCDFKEYIRTYFTFWTWLSTVTCTPVLGSSTLMMPPFLLGGPGMNGSKRCTDCILNGVFAIVPHLDIYHGFALPLFESFGGYGNDIFDLWLSQSFNSGVWT